MKRNPKMRLKLEFLVVIARQHSVRYCFSNSVRPSVRHVVLVWFLVAEFGRNIHLIVRNKRHSVLVRKIY